MTIVTTRPNQTLVGGGIEVEDAGGGGGAAAVLADNLDTTYVTFHHDNHPFFGFAEPNLAPFPGCKVKEGRLKWKARRVQSSATPLAFNWHMKDPSNGTNIFGSRDEVGAPAQAVITQILTDNKAGSPHVAPTNILADCWSHGNSAAPSTLVYALYFETVIVERPVVTVTFPASPVIGDTTPAVDWESNLDTDGGRMTHFEVKLFDGAGAVDPDADAASQESGILTADEGDNWAPPELLLDGDWQAFVRVAQTVNTELHWSAWASLDFEVQILRPGVPTMTLTSEPNSARIKILLTTNAGPTTTNYYQTQFSDDAGTTWHDVWTTQGSGRSTPSGNAATIYDYEAPNGGTRSYRARSLHTYPEGYATSAWTAIQTSSWTSDDVWLKSLESPSLNITVMTKGQPSAERAGGSASFSPLVPNTP